MQEICQRVKSLNKRPERLRILLHTDAAQALGKIRVDACELGVDYLTIVGHKVRNQLDKKKKIQFGVTDMEKKRLLKVPRRHHSQFYAPRIGALFVNGPGRRTPLYPMLFGGGQERNFRPGYTLSSLRTSPLSPKYA